MFDELPLFVEGSDRGVAVDDFAQVAQERTAGDTLDPGGLFGRRNGALVEPDDAYQYRWEDYHDPRDGVGCNSKDRHQLVELNVAASNFIDQDSFNDAQILTEAVQDSAEGRGVEI